MALVNYQYCNASLGVRVDFDYDNVAHTVVSGSAGGPVCVTGIPAGVEIASQTVGAIKYSIRTQNASPYGYVVAIPLCTVDIPSIAIGDSATDESNDGTITITATGNGTLAYSINNGQTYQSSNLFTGLAPGTYNIRVKNTYFGVDCIDTDTAVVGFTTIACDMVLGNITKTAAPGGTITVVSVITAKPYAIEYRLDAGTWQDSPVFTGLSAATYSVQARFKLYTSCSDSRSIDVDATFCDISLGAIELSHESAKYADDGIIRVYATSTNGPIEYSIDDGATYQSGNIFSDLQPGVYIVRIKDAGAGCESSQTVEIFRYKIPFAEFPIAQPHRVVLQSGPFVTAGKQNMDNTLFGLMRYQTQEAGCYKQQWKNDEVSKVQWRSSYSAHTVKIYDSASVLEDTLTPVKKTGYIGKTDTRTANFSDAGASQTQVWFPGGMPNFYEIGQDLVVTGNVSLNGTYEIVDIRVGTLEAEGNLALIIDLVYTPLTDPATATVDTLYDVEDWDVWECAIDWAEYGAGKYYLVIVGTDDQFAAFSSTSEPVEIVAADDDLLSIAYYNLDNAFKLEYSTGITFLMRVEGELRPDKPGGERETMEDSRRRPINLREYVTRILRLNVQAVPYYIAEKLKLILAHDYVLIDGKEYQKAEDVDIEFVDDLDAYVNLTVKLREANFMAENAHDSGDVDATLLELGEGEIMEIEP
jgi:hypothetical protein